jgi:hypothetical protein
MELRIVGRFACFFASALMAATVAAADFRPPAVPLVTFDPYLSIWSRADRLADAVTTHWTHRPQPLVSLIRVDGEPFRLIGPDPANVPAFPQQSVRVEPTRTIYEFDDARIHITLIFMTTALPDDLSAFSQPLSYVTWEFRSVDGAVHSVQLFDSTSSLLAVNDASQPVKWSHESAGELTVLRVGTTQQPILKRAGDDTRIDWGYAYAAAPSGQMSASIGSGRVLQAAFVQSGALPAFDDSRMPRAPADAEPVLAFASDLGEVNATPLSRTVIVAYDEIYAIKYFGKSLRPYWRRNGQTPDDMLIAAFKNFPALARRCESFDDELVADLTKIGGREYADIASLAYRQCAAACGLAADSNGKPLFFTKENTSNGDVATVDVIFPVDPVWILLSPTLAKASLVSVLDYGASPRWHFPCSPHDLGTYPIVRGTDDGGEAMPVEESGNVLILMDAIAHAEGNADFSTRWWPTLTNWAQYLKQFGLDPADQLCTDDFMGHLAHNANLSIKAIIGLAAYGDLCRMRDDVASANRYGVLAKADADHWIKVAEAGNRSLLAFDKPGTWSQKYNLVWDRILGLNCFPPEIARNEVRTYLAKAHDFGVPLDSRTTITKTDWTIWSATLAENPADFGSIVSLVHRYLNETTAREPLADSYNVADFSSGGMHARPVVGGVFIKMLSDRAMWHKWASKDMQRVDGWAPLPPRPVYVEIVPTSRHQPVVWHYTTTAYPPANNWFKPGFDDSAWKQGPGGFGSFGTPGAVVRTQWTDTPGDIWLRRAFTLPGGKLPRGVQLLIHHDEDVEVYINGVLAASDSGYLTSYQPFDISDAALNAIKPAGSNVMAVHCHQTIGGQYIDVGLVSE